MGEGSKLAKLAGVILEHSPITSILNMFFARTKNVLDLVKTQMSGFTNKKSDRILIFFYQLLLQRVNVITRGVGLPPCHRSQEI